MILGRITGKVSTTNFQFNVTSTKTRKFQFIQVHHPDYGVVLAQVMELERTQEELLAHCNVIGYKDIDNRLKGIRTPFSLNTEVLEAEDSFIKRIIELQNEGGFIGNLEGKNIPINLDLQKILTKHLCVLAKSGAGKSYAVGVLVEEILDKNVPLIIIDPHGEYAAMKYPTEDNETLPQWNLKPKGYITQIQEYGDMNLKSDVRPLKLNEKMNSYELMKLLPIQLTSTQEAMLFSVIKDMEEINFDNILLGLEQLNSSAKWAIIDTIMYLRDLKIFSPSPTPLQELVKPGKCTIINLKGITPEVQDVIVYKLLKDVFLARKQEKIPPFFCIIEEAHNFCPEKGFGKAKSLDIIRLISSEGRKFGLGLCVVSQRPALVQKTILAQCSTQLIMKVTNPNDLRSLVGSIEGITAETEQEIQNLAIGSALLCGFVDRPLVVNIRPKKSKHGGHAIDMLSSSTSLNLQETSPHNHPTTSSPLHSLSPQTISPPKKITPPPEEYQKDIIAENKNYAEQGILPVILPQITMQEIRMMADKPINKITTYLIPSVLFNCDLRGIEFQVLIDRIKGKIIVDPDKDIKQDLAQVSYRSNFLRKMIYQKIAFDIELPQQLPTEKLHKDLSRYCSITDFKECFIVYYKVEYK
jgi:DNA helicase HerA-like ATPase